MIKKRFFCVILCLILTMSVLPVNALADSWEDYAQFSREFELLNVKAAALLDSSTGEVIWGINEEESLPPASTVKIMTVLMTLEAIERGDISVNDTVTITGEMISSLPYDASGMVVRIEEDEVFTVLDLLYATMIVSDCFTSNALAYYISGSVENFAELMNTRAAELGCTDTVFTNPSGYPDGVMRTTAHSLCIILSEAMKYDLFRDLASAVEYTVPQTNLNDARTLKSHNRLLVSADEINEAEDYFYPYATGSKTGFSTPSGRCLASAAEKDGTELIAVVLGGEIVEDSSGKMIANRYIDTIQMFEYGFCALDYRIIRADMASQKYAAMEASRMAASDETSKALEEDTVVVSAFKEMRELEEASRTEFIIYITAGTGALILVFVIIFIIKKLKNKVKV